MTIPIGAIIVVSVFGFLFVCTCWFLCWYQRQHPPYRADVELEHILNLIKRSRPEVPVVEHVVNVEPPPAVTFHIESTEQLQPVQDGERIAIVVD